MPFPSRFSFDNRFLLQLAFFIALVLAAFARGNQLFSFQAGVVYAIVALSLGWLFIRFWNRCRQSVLPLALYVVFLTVSVSILAFPVFWNPSLQIIISVNQQHEEIMAILRNEPGIKNPWLESRYLGRERIVTIHGSGDPNANLTRLKYRVQQFEDCTDEPIRFEWQLDVKAATEQ